MKIEEKKHVKPKCDCKRKKRKKNQKLGHHRIENQEKHFFPYYQKS